ncbi:MAG: TetR/AcrR family transcriptional regulator [Ilumatobacter sp.]|uniref:TetR/AcrR family transcriptional regulator n=1 Tax=Ilumatobacter sp. TaxID=1967498 RepID=UPI003298EB94
MAKSGPRKQAASNDDLRERLVDATARVLAREGFAHTSARAVAEEAGTVNGSIFYYFGSMDGLLAATANVLADRGIARIREGLGGPSAHVEWRNRLGTVLRAEAASDDGHAVMELFVGARTSPALAIEVRAAIDRAVDFATSELELVLGSSPITQLIPVSLIAELAAATILGVEIFQQNGRDIDLERVASVLDQGIRLIGGSSGSERSRPNV